MISDTKPTPRLMGWFGDGEKLEFFLSVQFISICLETGKGKIIAKFEGQNPSENQEFYVANLAKCHIDKRKSSHKEMEG
jgi:hypothetical protein